jgi:hypothetical protein
MTMQGTAHDKCYSHTTVAASVSMELVGASVQLLYRHGSDVSRGLLQVVSGTIWNFRVRN